MNFIYRSFWVVENFLADRGLLHDDGQRRRYGGGTSGITLKTQSPAATWAGRGRYLLTGMSRDVATAPGPFSTPLLAIPHVCVVGKCIYHRKYSKFR
jgi:hypothetical protein